VENVFTTFFLTLLHHKHVENVGPYPQIALKTLKQNIRKTFGKRSKNVGVEQPCWALADGELAWGTCLASRRGVARSMNLGRASFRRPISGNRVVFVLRRTHCTQPHSDMAS